MLDSVARKGWIYLVLLTSPIVAAVVETYGTKAIEYPDIEMSECHWWS